MQAVHRLRPWIVAGFAALVLVGSGVAVATGAIDLPSRAATVEADGPALGAVGPAAPTAGRGCENPIVSAPETVLSVAARTERGLAQWPDTQPGVLKVGGRYRFLSTDARPTPVQHMVVGFGTLDAPVADAVTGSAVVGAPTGYQYVGAGQVYQAPGGGPILQVVHLERALNPGHTRYYTQIGLALVDPASYVPHFLGLVLTPELTFGEAMRLQSTVDLGTPSLVAPGDGYLYTYVADFHLDRSGRASSRGLTVARTALPAALAAATAGTVTRWDKLLGQEWDSPALGGTATDLQITRTPNWEPSAAWSPALARMLVVAPISTHQITLSQSAGTTGPWSAQQLLFSDPGRFDAYPVIVGTGDDPAAPGATFYVYYLQWRDAATPDWATAVQLRRTVTCRSAAGAGSLPSAW